VKRYIVSKFATDSFEEGTTRICYGFGSLHVLPGTRVYVWHKGTEAFEDSVRFVPSKRSTHRLAIFFNIPEPCKLKFRPRAKDPHWKQTTKESQRQKV
jgi:hypothetical protein